MPARFGKYLLVFVLVATTGGHWVFLQSVAWVGMAIQYSAEDSVPVALEKTFDGRHPCQLCRAVAAGKKAEQKQAILKSDSKLDLARFQGSAELSPPGLIPLQIAEIVSPPARADAPPVPPPRQA